MFNKALCRPVAEVLGRLGSEHVLVVHAEDGLDEISLAAPTHVAELRAGEVTEFSIAPEDFGVARQELTGLTVANSQESLALVRAALGNEKTDLAQKAQDLIALNAGAAIYVSGAAASLAEGVTLAQDALGSGLAKEKVSELMAFSAVFAEH